MTPVRIGKPQTPYLVRGLEGTFDVLFALVLGKGTDLLLETEKHEPRSVTLVNKFSARHWRSRILPSIKASEFNR